MSDREHYTGKEDQEAASSRLSNVRAKCCLILPNRRFVGHVGIYLVILIAFLAGICRGNDAEPLVVFAIFTSLYCLLITSILVYLHKPDVEELKSMDKEHILLVVVQFFAFPLVVYCAFVLVTFLIQPMFIYPGAVFEFDSEVTGREESKNFPEKIFSVVALDGERILGWKDTFGSGSDPAIPLLYIGGIGGTMWSNVGFATEVIGAQLSAGRRFEVFSYSYRGYEPNEKLRPSEDSLIQDAIAVHSYITDLHNGTNPILLAHSLGTGSAVALAEHFSQRTVTLHGKRVIPPCIALFTPFAGVHRVALDLSYYATFPFIWGLDAWLSYDRVTRVDRNMPLIVFSAGKDETILAYQHRALFAFAPNLNKTIVVDPDAGHNDLKDMVEIEPTAYEDWFNRCFENM